MSLPPPYCAFDIVQKGAFCLALYTEEVNLQTFIMIWCKAIYRNYLCTKSFILVIVFFVVFFFKSNMFAFSALVKWMQIMQKSVGQVTEADF